MIEKAMGCAKTLTYEHIGISLEATGLSGRRLFMRERISVLLADDSEVMRRAIRALLMSHPQIVVLGEARDYRELFKMVTGYTPDIVLMDMRMPSEERIEPAVIKDRLRGSCLLAMSVWTDEETATIARTYGAPILLDKSNLGATLIPAIQQCARENSYKEQSSLLAIS
jgi:DNA-binding NarL/FixJ family response regulator